MSFSLSELRSYLKRHPRYLRRFAKDLLRLFRAKLQRKALVVLTTESEGLGGYLWARGYYDLIRDHYQGRCCIILLGMAGWEEFVRTVDSDQVDVFRPFESCDSHKLIERLFFKFFTADLYIDFRAICIPHLVRARRRILGPGYKAENCFYREANNHTISQLLTLPEGFRHHLPLHPVEADWMKESYVVLVEGGFTQGKLTDDQLLAVARDLLRRGYRIFFNGDIRRLPIEGVIDGYQYPLHQYATIISGCAFMLTPNTLLYHYAVQLDRPCIVLSANEYLTVDLAKRDQIIIFNSELETLYRQGLHPTYRPDPTIKISKFPPDRLVQAIDELISRQLD